MLLDPEVTLEGGLLRCWRRLCPWTQRGPQLTMLVKDMLLALPYGQAAVGGDPATLADIGVGDGEGGGHVPP